MSSKDLRQRIKNQKSFADAVDAFFRLLDQSDLTWNDLLEGLDHPGLIAESAMIRLHNFLCISTVGTGFNGDKIFWKNVLQSRDIPLDSLVAAWIKN